MGRIHGFLGGALLTSALTYYTGEYFHKNSRVVSLHLRASNDIINNRILSDTDANQELVPVSKHINYTSRQSIAETSKDIWNDEIIKMVNWLYSINWYQTVVNVDKKINTLTSKVASSVEKS